MAWDSLKSLSELEKLISWTAPSILPRAIIFVSDCCKLEILVKRVLIGLIVLIYVGPLAHRITYFFPQIVTKFSERRCTGRQGQFRDPENRRKIDFRRSDRSASTRPPREWSPIRETFILMR